MCICIFWWYLICYISILCVCIRCYNRKPFKSRFWMFRTCEVEVDSNLQSRNGSPNDFGRERWSEMYMFFLGGEGGGGNGVPYWCWAKWTFNTFWVCWIISNSCLTMLNLSLFIEPFLDVFCPAVSQVFVHWKQISSDDRFPILVKGLEVKFTEGLSSVNYFI